MDISFLPKIITPTRSVPISMCVEIVDRVMRNINFFNNLICLCVNNISVFLERKTSRTYRMSIPRACGCAKRNAICTVVGKDGASQPGQAGEQVTDFFFVFFYFQYSPLQEFNFEPRTQERVIKAPVLVDTKFLSLSSVRIFRKDILYLL